MPITIQNTSGGGVTLDSTTSSNETLQLPSGGGTLAPLASPSFTGNVGVTGTNAAVNVICGGVTEDSNLNFVQGSTTEGGITYDHNSSYASEKMIFKAGNNTTHMTIMGDGRGLSQFTAKAWVDFNGTGTPAINSSHNISSISDGGVGVYYPQFTVNMSATNYPLSANSHPDSYDDENCAGQNHWVNQFMVQIRRTSNGFNVDNASIQAIVFGD